jgi:hypothetical protein
MEPLVATGGESVANQIGAEAAKNKPKPLPCVATGCRSERMVSRASALGCHPLLEVSSL